jgi:Na+/proline symporter
MIINVLGTIACIAFGLHHLGGVVEFSSKVVPSRLQAIKPGSFGFDGEGFGLLPMIFGGIVLYASYYGCDQTQAQRALAAKNTRDKKLMMLSNAPVRFPITILYCLSGLIVGTLAMSETSFMQQIPADNPDWMMPIFILNYLPHGMIGILVVAILAAAMSSLSSAINSLAAVSIEDYCRLTNKQFEPEEYLEKAKYIGLAWGAVTLVLSLYAGDIAPTVIEAINKVGSVFYGPILGVFLLAVIDKKLQAREINVALVAGVAINIFVWLNMENVFWFWWNFIGFASAVIVAYAIKAIVKSQPRVQPAAVPREIGSILTKLDVVILLGAFVTMLVICVSLPYMFV